jgi:hypothetical protein
MYSSTAIVADFKHKIRATARYRGSIHQLNLLFYRRREQCCSPDKTLIFEILIIGMPESHYVVLGVVVLVLLAGCAGSPTGDNNAATNDSTSADSSAQISGLQVGGQSGEVVVSFNRTVSSVTILLTDRNQTTIDSQSVEEPRNQTQLALPNRSGNYTVLLKQTDTVLDSQTLTLATPSPLVNMTPVWDGNTLTNLSVDITNDGDVNTNASVFVYHLQEAVANSSSRTVSSGETTSLDLGDGGDVYRTNASGEITLRVVVKTTESVVEREIATTVPPGEIEIISLSPDWEENSLESVDYTLSNVDNTSATGRITITASDDTILTGINHTLQGGVNKTFSYDASYESVFPDTTTNLTVEYNGTTVSESVTNDTYSDGGGGGGY